MSDIFQEMSNEAARVSSIKALTIFETRADLYHRRTGHLAPGKDCRMRDTGSEENRQRFQFWRISGLMQIDSLLEIARLQERMEAMEARAEKAAAQLAEVTDDFKAAMSEMREDAGLGHHELNENQRQSIQCMIEAYADQYLPSEPTEGAKT